MTPGIASRAMQANRCLQEVTHLIIDEVHERDIETEILLLLVKSLMARNPSIKIILMSIDSLRIYWNAEILQKQVFLRKEFLPSPT